MTNPDEPFNPLNMVHLGESIAGAMLSTEAKPLSDLATAPGAGIYAIYYTGTFPAYSQLAAANQDGYAEPIYVGKAVPEGSRKGVLVSTDTRALYERLKQHRRSIVIAENLDLADFHYRRLVVESIWIPLGESLLISRFAPLWNTLIDGFGNNDPGKGRHNQERSRWDVLHPGRSWVVKLQPRRETPAEIAQDAIEYQRQRLEP